MYNINIHAKKKPRQLKKFKWNDEAMAEQKLGVMHSITEFGYFS